MKTLPGFLFVILLLLAGVNALAAPRVLAQSQPLTLPPGFIQEVIAQDLGPATAFAMTPAGSVLIARKHGSVKVLKDGSVLESPFIDISGQTNTYGDRGLMGIALHPNFPNPAYVYFAFAHDPPGAAGHDPSGARVARVIRVEADPANLDRHLSGSEVVLLGANGTFDTMGNPDKGDRAPFSCTGEDGAALRDCLPVDGPSHTVDGLVFGPDGALYVSTGDATLQPEASVRALDIDSLAGKILRVNPITGNGYADNPFFDGDAGSNRSKVYALGLRNPFRFTFEPGSGRIVIGDVGGERWEEINRGFPGANFGWPCFEGAARLSNQPECDALFRNERLVTHALYAYPHESAYSAAIGGAFYTHTQFPASYQGAYFFADHNRAAILAMTFGADGEVAVREFAGNAIAPVQITVGADGALYVLSFTRGTLTRIRYAGGGNTPPLANAAAAPASGPEPLVVTFSSKSSVDPDGGELIYDWQFGDGGESDDANPVYTYVAPGEYQAQLIVTDADGASVRAAVTVYVGGSAPTVRILAPADESAWRVGEPVSLLAEAHDAEDGRLQGASLQWEGKLHHNDHVHIDAFHAEGEAATFTFEPHGPNTYIELCVTATDADGLQDSACADLRQAPASPGDEDTANPPPAPQTPSDESTPAPIATPELESAKRDGAPVPASTTGRILREIWWNLAGAAVSDLSDDPRFQAAPDEIDYLPRLDSSSLGKDYGVRIRGYLVPPVDGDYRFWIASDDSSELWLSTDADAHNKRYLAGVSGWTPHRGWDQTGGQASAPVALEAGRRYYIEILHKQADQKDSLSVAWQIPGYERTVIDGSYLSP
jgi:glucose/arabinose dehydrogenase